MFSPEVIELFEGWVSDADGWNRFARDYLKVNLDKEQDEALFTIRHNKKTAISSGTSRGKDYLMATAAICCFYLTPEFGEDGRMTGNTKVVLTGPTNRQVMDIIMPEISRIFKHSVYLPGELVSNGINTPFDEWFLTAFKADGKNTEAWTGYHAANIFFGVTEATGLPQEVFNAIEGNLQGNSRLVLVFNPNINHGYAASSFKDPDFKKIRLNSLHAPNVVAKRIIHPGQVDYSWVTERLNKWCQPIAKTEVRAEDGDFEFEEQWYRPDDLFRAKVLGLFPKVSEGVLVPPEWIELANQRWKEMQQGNIITPQGITGTPKEVMLKTKALRLGVDVAGMGRDSSCFCHRHGRYVAGFEKLHGGGTANHMEVVGKVVTILKANTSPMDGLYAQAFIDTIGEGAGVYSRMDELVKEKEGDWLKDRFFSCKFSEAAVWNELPLKDHTGQYEFLNLRAWLYWAVRDWLNPANKNDAALPPDDELLQELSETQWKFMSNGKIQLESKEDLKKRLKRSPDKADAFANTFYPVPDVDPRPQKKMNVAQFFH